MRNIILVIFLLLGTLACNAQVGDPDDSTNRQHFAEIGDFKLESGAIINDCRIGYRTFGKLNEAKSNAILFPSWYNGTSQDIERFAPPWLSIDTNRFYLIIVDALGDGVSSSPSNSKTQHGTLFPPFTIRDMVASQHEMLTKTLDIKRLYAVVGIAMGGMQTFQWGISYPSFSPRLIPIVGTPQPTSYDLIEYNLFRKIIRSDSAYSSGNYKKNPIISAASMLMEFLVTTPDYKSRIMSRDSFAMWQHYVDTAKASDWNNAYYQLLAMINHDIARDYEGSLKKAADHIKARMLIIVSRQDHLINPIPAMQFAKFLSAKLVMMNNELGHEAPDFDDEAFGKNIRMMLADLE